MEVKGISKQNNFIVLDAKGMQALMLLTTLLWQDKTCINLAKVAYDKNTITIDTKDFIYKFTNVPIQWDGNIDTHIVYGQHIQELKESEVI